jgi:Skp family chaperone for outer membrane proteins
MKFGRRITVETLVCHSLLAALLGSFLVAPSLARADASPPPKIAVANTARIFNDMQETKDLKQQLEARHTEVSNEESDRKAKIQQMEDNIKELRPDNPQYQKSLEDLDKAMAEFEAWGKVVQLEAERDQKHTMVMLFDKIQATVTQVAKDDQIDIVIADQGPEIGNTEGMTFDQLRALINQKDVLYTSKRADISDEVLTRLDAQYAKDKAAGSGK